MFCAHPCPAAPAPISACSVFKSAFVLLSGNGVAWLLFSGLWGSLIFKYMFPQQVGMAVLCAVFHALSSSIWGLIFKHMFPQQVGVPLLCAVFHALSSSILGSHFQIHVPPEVKVPLLCPPPFCGGEVAFGSHLQLHVPAAVEAGSFLMGRLVHVAQ